MQMAIILMRATSQSRMPIVRGGDKRDDKRFRIGSSDLLGILELLVYTKIQEARMAGCSVLRLETNQVLAG